MVNRSTELLTVLCNKVAFNKQKQVVSYVMRRTTTHIGVVLFGTFFNRLCYERWAIPP